MSYKTYSFHEYSQMIKSKKELKEIEFEINYYGFSEFIAKRILADPKLKATFIVSVAGLMCSPVNVFAAGNAMSKINTGGSTIFNFVRGIGYWICIIMCVVEILRSLANGDTKSIGKVIAKYVMAFGATYIVPWLFDLIREAFS